MNAKPSAWQPIAVRLPHKGTWTPMRDADITPTEAQAMVDEGIALTAQRRQDDGSMLLLFRWTRRR